jgi:hypothetical protein
MLHNQKGVVEIAGDGREALRVRRSGFTLAQTRLAARREQMRK